MTGKDGPKVVVAGATGWAGSALSIGLAGAPDMTLVGAVARSTAGQRLGDVIGHSDLDVEISSSVADAMRSEPDVVVEYTHPTVAFENVMTALNHGAHVVVGTSGLTAADYSRIDRTARELNLGVLACGNFSITAVLMMRFSELAAYWLPSWEVIDYAGAAKADAPSGTALELADRLAGVGTPDTAVPIADTVGETAARGATVDGNQIHSVRLPSFVISIESIFGQPDERLTIRHDAGPGAGPYVIGAMLAVRNVGTLVGLHRGLDTVMDIE